MPDALCKLRRLAIERQARDLERLPALGYTFDEAEADRWVTWYASLRHHKGEWAGKPFVLADWQEFEIVRPVFGWKRPDGTRRFRTVYIEVPRKDGKTELAAGAGLGLTVADREPGAEVYSAATKKDQAKIAHTAAKEMLKRSAALKRWAKQLRNVIYCERLGSKFEPLGADSETLDGLNAHGLILDEMHAHKDRHVHDVLTTSMGARRQPLTFIITTAGIYDPESIGWELHDTAIKVLEGSIEDESFFAYVTSADEGDDWREPATWAKANPNLGVSVKLDYLTAECQKAVTRPSYENTFKRYHLNIWTQQVERWIPIEHWNACEDAKAKVRSLEEFRGRRCFAGLDLSSKIDMSALALLFPPLEGEVWDALWRFWVPQDLVAERARQFKRPDYGAWVRDGFVSATEGNIIDYAAIRNELAMVREVVEVQEIAFDPWNASQIAVDLMADGFTLVEMRQGYKSLSEPSKMLEAMVAAKRLRHGNNPVMRWMISNVTKREDPNGNIAPDKSTAAGKIDGVVATIMGMGRGMLAPAEGDWLAESV